MAQIGLVDIDHHAFPNIALMKLSAYHKAKNDQVVWYDIFTGHCDTVYLSKVFSFSQDYAHHIDADHVYRGGSGYAIQLQGGRETYDRTKDEPLPDEVEHIYPDYSLYPDLTSDTAYGFLTRGCPRQCAFCHVKDKEGTVSHKVADLSEFWHGQKNIVLCDPNILACPDWSDLFAQLADSKAYIDFNQGLDARLMTKEKAEAISRTKVKEIHFAWDRYEDRDKVLRGLQLYADNAERKPHSHNAIVFTIVNFDTTLQQDLERIYTLRDMGYWAYVMVYDRQHAAPIYRKLQRWVNNRFIFAKCESFDKYLTTKF